MGQALRHPRTPIALGNPGTTVSPIPWWGSLAVIIVGIASWVLGVQWSITGLDEVGHALVYLPLSNLFGVASRVGKM